MARSTSFVIIGGGLAAAKAAEALRDNGFDGHIVLFADEEHLPYERPPLSKEYLAGKKSLTDFTVHNSDWYRDHNVDLRLGAAGDRPGPRRPHRRLPDGTTVRYDKLLLATGSASRRPPIPGSTPPAVHYLRTYDDAVALNSVLTKGRRWPSWRRVDRPGGRRRLPASAASTSPSVESAKQPLLAALGETVGEVFATLHREHGVDSAARGAGRGDHAGGRRQRPVCTLRDGSTVAGRRGAGGRRRQPNIELAKHAGLSLGDGGVLVDAVAAHQRPRHLRRR